MSDLADQLRASILLKDAEGVEHEYLVSPEESRNAWENVSYEKDDGKTYLVRFLGGGQWSCTCHDFIYRRHHCKHILSRLAMKATKTEEKIDAEILEETPAAQPIALVNGATTPAQRQVCSNLASALSTAQQKCRAVAKDSKNIHFGYKYASAEAIITEAKEAFADTGLALAPIEMNVDGHSKEGHDRFELSRKFLLMHESGESLPISIHWPVVLEKGRPLDKATAIADTNSFAYLLRDLLQMPRISAEDDDVVSDPPPPPPPETIQHLSGLVAHEDMAEIVPHIVGKTDYATDILTKCFGVERFSHCSRKWLPMLKTVFERSYRADYVLQTFFAGKKVNEMTDSEGAAAEAKLLSRKEAS